MKWCMVAAMAVSLLFSGMAWAQEDDFDLDALLGDVGTEEVAEAAPAVEETVIEEAVVVEEAVAEEAVAEGVAVEEVAVEAAPAEEVVEADPFADMLEEAAAEEVMEEAEMADEAAEGAAIEEAAVVEEAAAVEAVEEADPFADLGMDEVVAEEAPAEEAVAEEAVVEEGVEADPFADLGLDEVVEADVTEEVAAPIEEDLLGGLLDDDLAIEEAPMEELAPIEEMNADFSGMEVEEATFESTSISSPAKKKAKKDDGEVKLTKRQLKKIAKEEAKLEEIRRQADDLEAKKTATAGFTALVDEEYLKAETSFAKALDILPERPQNSEIRGEISAGLAQAKYQRARLMIQKERLLDARLLLDAALIADSENRGAQSLEKRLQKLEKKAAIPKKPAEQAATIEKAKTIQQEFDEARQWYRLKDYDRASALFENILLRDPYHKSSMRFLRKIEANKFKLATYEREARIQGMMTDVRRSWSPPVRANIKMPEKDKEGEGVDSKPAAARLQDKMQDIIIPAVEFRQANINDVVNFLVEASIAADEEGEGVNIILNIGQSGVSGAPVPMMADPAAAQDEWGFEEDFGAPAAMTSGGGGGSVRDITLNLRRISMLDAIKYITEVANLKYRIEDSAVIITPVDAPVGNIITRMYPVQPSFMDVIVERETASDDERGDAEFTSMGGRVSMAKGDVKEFFQNTGVKFPTGASITYNSAISQLIVANTADNLETFERILQQLNVIPNQVEIEARFIEVAQDDLEELGLQWILNDNYEFASKNDGSGQRMQVNANNNGLTQGLRFFTGDTSKGAITPASLVTQTANQTMLGGILSASSVLTNPEMTVVIQALSQHGGTDLLSAPRVTTRSGVNAQIQVVKEIIYPTEFEVTQPTMNTDGNVTMSPVVTPGTFTTRETGVILNVTPTVGPDGYTIDLVMAPEVAELVDWIQYGSAITVTTGIIGARQENTYLFNMPQPVFTSRNVTTSIVIWDGQTVVMGGLIREELTTIKDKVPILGDIPILGWFFRSEGQYSKKMNLLIFVTARLVDPAGRPIHNEANMAMPGAGIDAASPVVGASATP